MLDQMRYLTEFDGKLNADERRILKDLELFAQRVKTIKPGDPPVVGGGSSAPATHWLALRDYDSLVVAAGLRQRILVLQGARDYQVTTADYERWMSALNHHPNTKTILCPDLNHLFITGQGRSYPSEYSNPRHVMEAVIVGIAEWVNR